MGSERFSPSKLFKTGDFNIKRRVEPAKIEGFPRFEHNSGVNGKYWASISPRFAVPMGRREHQVMRPAAELARSSMVQRNPGSAPFCSHRDSWQWLIWMFIPPKYGISMYFKGFDPQNGAIRLKSNDVAELGSTRAKHPRDLLKNHGSTFQST